MKTEYFVASQSWWHWQQLGIAQTQTLLRYGEDVRAINAARLRLSPPCWVASVFVRAA